MMLMAAINAGAWFLLKDTEPKTLLSSIRTVYQGNAIIAPSATKRLIERMTTGAGLTAARPSPHTPIRNSMSLPTASARC